MYCASSELKVWLYTGGKSWGSCAGKEFQGWSVEVVFHLQTIGDFPQVPEPNMTSTTSSVAQGRTAGQEAVAWKDIAFLQQCLAAKLHHKLPWLLCCAEAAHVRSGSQFWLGFPYLTLIPLSIWTKCVCNVRQRVCIISVLYEVFANTKKRDSKILLLSCKTWIGGSIFSRCVQFHTCDDCTVWSVEVRSWTWCLCENLGQLGVSAGTADGLGHVGSRRRLLE